MADSVLISDLLRDNLPLNNNMCVAFNILKHLALVISIVNQVASSNHLMPFL